MNNLLTKVYQQIICNEKEAGNLGKEVDEWVNLLVRPYENELNGGEMEKLKDLMYSTAIKAEQKGFRLGIKTVFELLRELSLDL